MGSCVIFVTPGTLMRRQAEVSGCGSDCMRRPRPPTVPGLSQAADRLDPTEGLFDPLSLNHADGVSRMAGGAAIDRRGAMRVVLRDMVGCSRVRGSRRRSRQCHRVCRPPAARLVIVLDHGEPSYALGGAVGLSLPRPLRNSRASGPSSNNACHSCAFRHGSRVRRCARHRPFPEGGSPPSFGMKLFIEA